MFSSDEEPEFELDQEEESSEDETLKEDEFQNGLKKLHPCNNEKKLNSFFYILNFLKKNKI